MRDRPFLQIDPSSRHVSLDARHPGFYSAPNDTYAALHSAAPTFYWEEQKRWYFTSYAQVNALLRDRRLGRQISHLPGAGDLALPEPQQHLRDFDRVESRSLLELEPPEHTRLRKLVNRAFVSRHVEKLRPDIEALAHQLIDTFEPNGQVELLAAFAEIIPVTVIARMIGVPVSMSEQLLKWSHDHVRMYLFGKTEEDEYRANRAAAEFSDYVLQLAGEKRKNPEDDLLTLMLQPDQNGEMLTDDEIVSTTVVLLNAGHEATVHQIGNATRTILESGLPPAMLFRDDLATERAVEECFRISAPVHVFERWVLEDLEIEGIAFNKGEKIGLILAAANLDEKKFTDPLVFKPERNEGQNLSFGAGIHFCIGAPLARLELQTALPILFGRLPGLRILEQPIVKDSYHFHGLKRLDVGW